MKVRNQNPIRIWNREKKALEIETVYGGKFLDFFYSSETRSKLFDYNWLTFTISKLIGYWQNSSWSKSEIPQFIAKFQINMKEFEQTTYSSFNDFFIRKFQPQARNFVANSNLLPAFCEGRYLAYSTVANQQPLPVKRSLITTNLLLANSKWSPIFTDGPALIARLCPTDYHRFHFPDSGIILAHYSIPGTLHSVNPLALSKCPKILFQNERQISILETEHFGKLAFIAIGAMCVGKIIESHAQERFERGHEKGYFLFGASCVVLLGEKGKWIPSNDILEQSNQGIETFIKLGAEVAQTLER